MDFGKSGYQELSPAQIEAEPERTWIRMDALIMVVIPKEGGMGTPCPNSVFMVTTLKSNG
jgi:hypothetical protein